MREEKFIPTSIFKENNALVDMGIKLLNANTVKQYQAEERSLIARRIRSSKYRVQQLLKVMTLDELSTHEKIENLKMELANHYKNQAFLDCKNMGEIMYTSLNLLVDGSLQ